MGTSQETTSQVTYWSQTEQLALKALAIYNGLQICKSLSHDPIITKMQLKNDKHSAETFHILVINNFIISFVNYN